MFNLIFHFFFTITVNFSIFSIFGTTCSLDCSASPLCVGCFESCRRRSRLESTCNDLQRLAMTCSDLHPAAPATLNQPAAQLIIIKRDEAKLILTFNLSVDRST